MRGAPLRRGYQESESRMILANREKIQIVYVPVPVPQKPEKKDNTNLLAAICGIGAAYYFFLRDPPAEKTVIDYDQIRSNYDFDRIRVVEKEPTPQTHSFGPTKKPGQLVQVIELLPICNDCIDDISRENEGNSEHEYDE